LRTRSPNGREAHGNRHATVDIVESVVRNNESSVFGGGISNSGELRLRRTEVTENKLPAGGGGVTSVGGGIYNARRLTVDDSTIAGNFATRGGGIANQGSAVVTNTTISGNRGLGAGGGIRSVGDGTLAINASTITANRANESGGLVNEPTRFGGGVFNVGLARIYVAQLLTR